MTIIKGSQALKPSTSEPTSIEQQYAQYIADTFLKEMSAFQAKNLPESDETMIYWHESFSEILTKGVEFPPVKKWLRPSMIGSDEQALWFQLHGYKSDQELLEKPQDPVHTRWQAIGTVVGDMWQKQVLSYEYWADKKGLPVKFELDTTENNHPMFEEFARKFAYIGGVPVWGTCDGVMWFFDGDKKVKVGFEVKSKQTTYASTGHWSMKQANEKHIEQVKTYALMYGLDYYIILYQNCAKKGWNMSEEDKGKYPDVRSFGVYISPEDKEAHVKYLQRLWNLKDQEEKPSLDLLKWNFNSYKKVILENLTREDFAYLTHQVVNIENSRASAFEKKSARQAYDDIEAYMIEHKGLYKDILGGETNE